MAGVRCVLCEQTILPRMPCLRVKEFVKKGRQMHILHYHLLTCCMDFRDRADDVLSAIDRSSYPESVKELIKQKIEGSVCGKVVIDLESEFDHIDMSDDDSNNMGDAADNNSDHIDMSDDNSNNIGDTADNTSEGEISCSDNVLKFGKG